MKPIYAKPKKIPTIPLSHPLEASTTAHNHLTGDAFFKNQIATVSPQYDADVKTGRALALSATNDLPIPTHVDGYITYHNLDTDTITQEATDGTDKVFNTITVNNILTHQMAFSAGDLSLIQQEPNLLAALALGEATPISSVTLDADDSWYACGEVSNEFVVDQRAGYGVETITNMTSSISGAGNTVVLDKPNREATIHIETATDFDTHPAVNCFGDTWTSDILHLEVTFTVSVGSVFIKKLNAGDASGSSININVNVEYGVGTHTYIYNGYSRDSADPAYFSLQMDGLNYPLQDSVSIYSMREATASEIADYNSDIRLTNQQKGLQTTALLLDGAGVPESYNSTPNTARVYDDTIISTGFKPSIAKYSIEEESSGLMQDFGSDSKQSATSIPAGVVES